MIDIQARMEMCDYVLHDVDKFFFDKPHAKKIVIPIVVDYIGDGVAITNHLRNHGYTCKMKKNPRWFDRFLEITVKKNGTTTISK